MTKIYNDVGKTGQSHARMKLDPIFLPYTKNQLKMKENLNKRPETIKLPEENVT